MKQEDFNRWTWHSDGYFISNAQDYKIVIWPQDYALEQGTIINPSAWGIEVRKNHELVWGADGVYSKEEAVTVAVAFVMKHYIIHEVAVRINERLRELETALENDAAW